MDIYLGDGRAQRTSRGLDHEAVFHPFPAVHGVAAYQVAPQAGFAHGGVGGLSLPIDAVQLVTGLHQHRADEHHGFTRVAVNGAQTRALVRLSWGGIMTC
jgi:hypothetical protein